MSFWFCGTLTYDQLDKLINVSLNSKISTGLDRPELSTLLKAARKVRNLNKMLRKVALCGLK